MNIGSNIRTIRKRKHITIAQICETTGLSQGFMSQVETNKTSPSIATLSLIADALNVPLAYLLLKRKSGCRWYAPRSGKSPVAEVINCKLSI